MKATGRTKSLPESQGVPEQVHDVERTRELPAVPSQDAKGPAPNAVPEQVISIEETVPFQSCIERTLLQEVLRRQSAEKDEDIVCTFRNKGYM